MSSEIETFRKALRDAGQPWSRRGIWTAGAGIVLLAATQFVGQAAPFVIYFFPLLIGSTLLIAVGWVMLIVAVVRRRRWTKAQALAMPRLSDPAEGAS